MKLRVVIVKGTYWDSAEGRKKIADGLADTEKIMGIKIDTGPYEVVDDASMKSYSTLGPWDGTNNYSPELVNTANKYGAPDRPAFVFTDTMPGDTPGVTVSKSWAGTGDGLKNEAIVGDKRFSSTDIPHEMGHLLSGESGSNTHNETDKNNLMYPYNDRTGTEWTDPWKSSANSSPYLK
jgi:hypothetical protein